MKVKVIEFFEDKITKKYHQVGEVIEIDDKNRLGDMISKNLVIELEETKPTTRKSRAK